MIGRYLWEACSFCVCVCVTGVGVGWGERTGGRGRDDMGRRGVETAVVMLYMREE